MIRMQSEPMTDLEIKTSQIKIGEYEIHALPTGLFGLDGGSMFGTVPKVLWEKGLPADTQNRIPMEARCLLLKSAHRNILVDTGNGEDFVAKYGQKLGQKFAQIYNIQADGPSLLKSLSHFGLEPEDIHAVLLTHLHFDHAGGATREGTGNLSGKIVPTFPNARYYLQAEHLKTAQNPNIREKASFFPSNYLPLIQAEQLVLLDGPTKIFPGVEVLVSHGHTIGQQHLRVWDESHCLFYCADLIPTSYHVRLAWIMGYDLDPLRIIEEKREILTRAAQDHWYLFMEHDPFCDACKVEKDGSDFRVMDRYALD